MRNAEESVAKERMILESGKVSRISNPMPVDGERVSKLTFGSCRGRVCEISIDGAWKKIKWANGS